jgi:glycosyltransferase involved in cell wall biosynthesis
MSRRHVLVCAPGVPEHDRECGSARVAHFLTFLQQTGWTVSFVAENAAGGDVYVRRLRRQGIIVYAGPQTSWAGDDYLAEYAQLLRTQHVDLVLIHFWYLAEQLIPLIRQYAPQAQIIVDTIDLHLLRTTRTELQAARAVRRHDALHGRHGDEMIRELNVYAAADRVLTVSQKEADLINDFLNSGDHAQAVPLAEDLAFGSLAFAERRGMVFVGNFRHPPNREAVRWLAEQIVPQLPAELLHAHPIRVIGNRLDDEIAALCTQAGLAAVGWVPSLTPYLAQARVALVPLLNGAGTKCKLIQSLMIGTPSVATPIGAEGLAVRDGRDLLIAQDAAGFAAAVTRLLADETLWRLIRAQGRETVLQLHSLPLVQARFLAVVEQLTEHAASARAQQGW